MNRLASLPGIPPSYAEQLEQNGVRTTPELAEFASLEELSARAEIPLDWLRRWQKFATEEVAAEKYRRWVVVILGALTTLALFWAFALARSWLRNAERLKAANEQFERANALYA